MSKAKANARLSPRLESALAELLGELSICDYRADRLVSRTSLPFWCRPPLFFFLGHLAKAEGRVTETDIGYAEALIKALKLSSRQRQQAIKRFRQGKDASNLPMRRGLMFRFFGRLWPDLALKVAICLCHGAQIKGQPGKARRYRCEDAIAAMGLPVTVSDEILESYGARAWMRDAPPAAQPTTYEQACRILGVSRRDSLEAVKKTYRRKVSSCHPDKLARQSLTAAERDRAKDQLLRYQQAWELIQRRHNLT
ncbi:co-chaperone DjlA [Marinobacter oulmenensis]|uniref:DnaJ like chaperone protein n=1 Tax=Marinobacter oulmenensis TaxID=643747 RepID=A0A840UB90_9GAMM|nr:molecular chaperone DjlA [Marinobacter oulmenensis]MBB5319775.1 DnaJ like chaperone protein [Marinobacter oulmenensis]